MTDQKTEAGAIADLAVKAAGVPIVVPGSDKREWLVLPDGMKATDISDAHGPAARKPPYVKQNVTLQMVDSLVDYANRFKTGDTVLFADIAADSITAVLDYHTAGGGADPKAAHAAHRGSLVLPRAEEWKIWSAVDDKLMPQLKFARFLEENAADVSAPSGGELLDVCRDLQGHRKVSFIKAVRTATDAETFEFTVESEAKTKGGVEVPTKFRLDIPVYFGEARTELYAFLRWDIDPEAGGLSLGIKLHRAEHVRQAVFKQIVLRVGEGTGCPVVFGKAS